MFQWLEEKIALGAGWVVMGSGVYWAVILAGRGLSGEPVLYTFYPKIATETGPLIVIAGVLGIAAVTSILRKALTGVGAGSFTLQIVAPWVFFISLGTLLLWMSLHPNKDASYLPLALLAVLSGWGWYATTWGFLQFQPRERDRVARATPAESISPARISSPKVKFSDIFGNEAVKGRLKDAALAITARRKDDAKVRNGILLHGQPGNGKNMYAEALAGELGLPFHQISYADVASQWVGEKSARVRQAFEHAKRSQPCVLFVDELDSFLESRDGDAGGGVKEDRDLVNAMLTLMVDIRQARVILVAATNHIDRLDVAGVREGRFDFKVEITPPDQIARVGLLRKGLREQLPNAKIEDGTIESVARRWNGFSSKRILAITEELPGYLKTKGISSVGFEEFMGALRQLQGQRGHVPEDVKPLEDLVFSPNTRDIIDQILGRMADPEHTERHGGTLPTGVLFWGPPGTGKTAACKALAKAIGWAYLPATGADLARDPKKLEALYAKAKDLRPTIIFIDEADELMRSRDYSPQTEATNKLLTLMDGVGDRVRDVVWIAATNNPDQIDAALLRGGRFTEKVEFEKPSAADLGAYLQKWLERRKVQLDTALTPEAVAQMVGNQSIANAEAVVQAALNRAVARREVPVVVSETDMHQALRMVLNEV